MLRVLYLHHGRRERHTYSLSLSVWIIYGDSNQPHDIITIHKKTNISLRFSGNSEATISEIIEKFEEISHCYYMCSDLCSIHVYCFIHKALTYLKEDVKGERTYI